MKSSKSRNTFTQEITGTVSEIINQVRKLIKEGNARRVMIQDSDGKVLFQSQLTVGVAGTVLLTTIAPIVSAISLFALMMNDIKIIVESYPEEEQANDEEYEVEAEFIEIRDEEEEQQDSDATEKTGQTEKTVGKDGEE